MRDAMSEEIDKAEIRIRAKNLKQKSINAVSSSLNLS